MKNEIRLHAIRWAKTYFPNGNTNRKIRKARENYLVAILYKNVK